MSEKGDRTVKRKLATLTPLEDKRWEQLFSHNVNSGMNDRAADEEAWQGLCEEFPRLRKYDGCKP